VKVNGKVKSSAEVERRLERSTDCGTRLVTLGGAVTDSSRGFLRYASE